MTNEKTNDLPLVSNVDDISVSHYIFYFTCDFKEKYFTCSAILFLEPVVKGNFLPTKCACIKSNMKWKHFHEQNNVTFFQNDVIAHNNSSKQSESKFVLVLDCHKILVDEVAEINFAFDECEKLKATSCKPDLLDDCHKLIFSADEWALKIWTESETCKICFPRIIRISYKTVPSGPSLLWVNDQDGNPAVFTYGAWINNRSLFPCQEPPEAMATWEATVSVSNSAVVLMSGDEEPSISFSNGLKHYYYSTKNARPLSTLCLAIGFWEEHVLVPKSNVEPKCRIFATSKLLDRSVKELFEYIPYCLKISEDILGPYPFTRIDFLIVPPTFGSLGMASPNIIFLSQSMLSDDGSMCSRLSHEIAHGWFGLLIGASDWSEEWLSEGFATFMEDYFHIWTTNMLNKKGKDYMEVKAFIRLKTLLDEISNTSEELQILRPSQGQPLKDVVDGIDAAILKNGQNPLKGFTQVHYIKGYFLLKYLSDAVGIEKFMHFLRAYVQKFQGQLVTSKDFLAMFFDFHPEIKKTLTIKDLIKNWLHNPGVPVELKEFKPSVENELFRKAMDETDKWLKINSDFMKKSHKRRKCCLDHLTLLTSEQIILLLENLLNEDKLSTQTLENLNEYFNFKETNAEVQHRWFELVVKYKYKCEYTALKTFLTDHLAMGVYLYGELLFSGDRTQKNIAEQCYSTLKHEMEPNYVTTIDQMLLDSSEN